MAPRSAARATDPQADNAVPPGAATRAFQTPFSFPTAPRIRQNRGGTQRPTCLNLLASCCALMALPKSAAPSRCSICHFPAFHSRETFMFDRLLLAFVLAFAVGPELRHIL